MPLTDFNLLVSSSVSADAGNTLTLKGAMVDGAAAIGTVVGSSVTLANATAKLFSVVNNAVEKAYIDKDGYYITAGDIGTKLYSQPLWRCLIVAAAGTPKDNTNSPSSTYTLTAGQVVMLQPDQATWVEITDSASMTLLGAKSILLEANEMWFYVVKSGALKISVDTAAGTTSTKLFTLES